MKLSIRAAACDDMETHLQEASCDHSIRKPAQGNVAAVLESSAAYLQLLEAVQIAQHHDDAAAVPQIDGPDALLSKSRYHFASCHCRIDTSYVYERYSGMRQSL